MTEIELEPIPPKFKEWLSKSSKKWHKEASPETMARWKANLKKGSKRRYESMDKEELRKKMSEMAKKRWSKNK